MFAELEVAALQRCQGRAGFLHLVEGASASSARVQRRSHGPHNQAMGDDLGRFLVSQLNGLRDMSQKIRLCWLARLHRHC